jgi:enoyl-CoA hydratase/carnithine racemase
MPKIFSLDIQPSGVAVVTFDRPPVNAVSEEVYLALRDVCDEVTASDARVMVLTAAEASRAWCGGADLNEFMVLDGESRKARYALINECLPRLHGLDRPVIAAMNGHAVGVGMVIASFCDIRIVAEDAHFSCPEIDRGVVAGGGGFFSRLSMPEGLVREMLYTGRRFTAEELRASGFFNRIVPRNQVLAKSMELAETIASKSLPALRANKICALAAEEMSMMEAYKFSQQYASKLTAMGDSKEGIRAFLERRDPNYSDA